MVSRQEAERIASAITILRGDWPKGLIMAVLGDDRCIGRPYADLAVAMTCVAVDPQSKKPGRIHEAGPWWSATTAQHPTPQVRAIEDGDCAICLRPPDIHSRLSWLDSHEWEPQHARAEGVPPTPEQREALAVAARAAEAARPVPPPKREPRDPNEVIAAHLTKEDE